jgi:hypothetical protein
MKKHPYLISIILFCASFCYGQCPQVSSAYRIESTDCTGTFAQIGVVTATAGSSYQVQKNGVNYGAPKVASTAATPFIVLTTYESGTYTVKASKSGCTDVSMNGSVTLTNPGAPSAPTGGVTTDRSPFLCQGESVTISATTGYSSYQWKKNGVNITGATSPNFTTSAAGNYSVLVSNGCGASSTWSGAPVSVNPTVGAPTTPVGTSSFCQGTISTSTYTSTASNASTYSWTISPLSAGTISTSGLVSWNSTFSGTATVSVVANGCGGPTPKINKYVTITEAIVISSAAKIQSSDCPGTVAQVGVITSTSGTTYQVRKDGADFGSPIDITTGNTPNYNLITTTSPGTYTIVATKAGCGTNVPMNGSVIVSYDNSIPQGSVDLNRSPFLCQGESVTLTATAGFATYQWSRNGQLINNATANTYSTTLPGSYSVYVANGCGVSNTLTGTPIWVYPTVQKPSTPDGKKVLCQGADINTKYSSFSDGATDYQWSVLPIQAGAISNTGLLVWSPTFTGMATISVVALGCNGPSVESTISVEMVGGLGLPVAPLGPTSACQGHESFYVSTAENAQAYSWQLFNAQGSKLIDNGYTSTTTSATIEWPADFVGIATLQVTATSTSGCNFDPVTNSVQINVKPKIGTLMITSGQTNHCKGTVEVTDFDAFAENADSYEWDISPSTSGSINNVGTVTFNPSFEGIASVSVKANGCSNHTTATNSKISVLNLPECLSNYNYIKSYSANIGGLKQSIIGYEKEYSNESSEYFDGLGRSIQKVDTEGSPSGQDIIQPIVYDEFGRETYKYLPFTNGTDGRYNKTSSLIDPSTHHYLGIAQSFYNSDVNNIANDSRPFSETIFEPSPLNRPVKTYGVGQNWKNVSNDKFIEFDYLINASNSNNFHDEKIICWSIDDAGVIIKSPFVYRYVETGGYYASNQLSISWTRDEHGKVVRQYTDRDGNVILKKVQLSESASIKNDSDWAQTYYVYDRQGNLVFVLPPEAVNQILIQTP